MKIGLLGGTFDPPHQGHLYIANLAIKKLGLDQLWLVPTVQNPLKNTTKTPFSQRFLACQKFAASHPKIYAKNYQNFTFSTYNLVKRIKNSHPNTQFYWIMGADSFQELFAWKKARSLIKSINFAIFPRKNAVKFPKKTKTYQIYQQFRQNSTQKLPKFIIFPAKSLDISSTKIRQLNDN